MQKSKLVNKRSRKLFFLAEMAKNLLGVSSPVQSTKHETLIPDINWNEKCLNISRFRSQSTFNCYFAMFLMKEVYQSPYILIYTYYRVFNVYFIFISIKKFHKA